jgi:hypothetical protein
MSYKIHIYLHEELTMIKNIKRYTIIGLVALYAVAVGLVIGLTDSKAYAISSCNELPPGQQDQCRNRVTLCRNQERSIQQTCINEVYASYEDESAAPVCLDPSGQNARANCRAALVADGTLERGKCYREVTTKTAG